MPQFREYTSTISISPTQIVLRSDINGNRFETTVVRDGSEDTNFAAACVAHKSYALNLPPVATSPPCSVATSGKWNKSASSGSLTTPATLIRVPSANSGKLNLYRDSGSFTMKYIKNGGTPTTFTDGTQITVADGDALAFSVTSLVAQEGASGSVADDDTAVQLDSINFFNGSAP